MKPSKRDRDWLLSLAAEISGFLRGGIDEANVEIPVPRELFPFFHCNVNRTNLYGFCGAEPETMLIGGPSIDGGVARVCFLWRKVGWNQAGLLDAKGIAIYPPIDFSQLTAIQG